MDTERSLLELEEALWRAAGDRGRYEEHLAGDALHVFPGWGVAARGPVLDAVEQSAPWETFAIERPEVVALGEDAAALVYSAHARRAGQAPYAAAVTSVYRRANGGWQLVLHQQTPLPA